MAEIARKIGLGAGAMTLLAGSVACGHDADVKDFTPGGNATPNGTSSSVESIAGSAKVTKITFDALGGNSSVIKVYKGPFETDHDKTVSGTFEDGQTAKAVCQIKGREVPSQPPETPRDSAEWVGLAPSNGETITMWAAETYLKQTAALGTLPPCQ